MTISLSMPTAMKPNCDEKGQIKSYRSPQTSSAHVLNPLNAAMHAFQSDKKIEHRHIVAPLMPSYRK